MLDIAKYLVEMDDGEKWELCKRKWRGDVNPQYGVINKATGKFQHLKVNRGKNFGEHATNIYRRVHPGTKSIAVRITGIYPAEMEVDPETENA